MSDATSMRHLNADLAHVSHGDRQYPAVFVPRCHTCQSPHRVEIERLLIDGLPPKMIISHLPEDCAVSPQSVKRHFARGHLPIDTEMVRHRQQIRAERRWEELGLAATAFMAERADIAEHVIDTCTRLVLEGQLKFSAATLMRAAEFTYRIENGHRQRQNDEDLRRQLVQRSLEELHRILQIVGEVGGDEIRDEVVRRACLDGITEIVMLADEFADLRQVAYLDADTSQNQPHFFQLSRSDLGHHQQVDGTNKVAA